MIIDNGCRPRWPVSALGSGPALYLLCVFLGVLGCGTAAATSLSIESEDPGRAIWVNGTFFGTDEVFIDSLLTETVVIEIGEPLYSSAWILPWQITLAEVAGAERRVEVPALQRLTLRSPVQPVRVQVDGRELGHTPLTLLVPRTEPVRLTAEVEPGSRFQYRQEWNYHPGGRPDSTLSLGPSSPAHSAPLVPEQHRWRDRSRYLLPLGAVVSGVLGVWARQTADRSYDNYLGTVDRARIESEYDRAARYDKIAIGCWAAAEALLVASVWTWLRGEGDSHVRIEVTENSTRLGLSLDGVIESLSPSEGGP